MGALVPVWRPSNQIKSLGFFPSHFKNILSVKTTTTKPKTKNKQMHLFLKVSMKDGKRKAEDEPPVVCVWGGGWFLFRVHK